MSPRLALALVLLVPGGAAATSSGETLDHLRVLVKDGKHAEAEAGARALLAEAEATKGPNAVECAAVLDLLVESLTSREEVGAEARTLAERAVAIKEQRLGPEHLDLAVSLSNLGNLLVQAGDAPAGVPFHERALAIREKALAPEHRDLIPSLHDLANALESVGQFDRARPLYERALAISEKVHGSDDPAVALSLNALAHILVTMNDAAAARPLYERALAINEKAYGPEDPEVAHSLYGLGDLLQGTGELTAARPLLERSVAILEKVRPEHPRLAEHLRRLGSLDMKLGDFAAARALLERSLTVTEKARGLDHPEVADSLNELASLLGLIGEYDTARTMYERALAVVEKAMGPDHPHVGVVLVNFANMLDQTGDYVAARPLFERALAVNEGAFGPAHPYVGITLLNFGQLFSNTGDYGEARRIYGRALTILEESLGPDHPAVAATVNNMAVVFERTRDYAAARPLYERSLAIQEMTVGPDHPDVALGLANVGGVLVALGDLAAARPLYERALAIQERALGPRHPAVAATLQLSAALLEKTGDPAAARPLLERALQINQEALGSGSPLVADTLLELSRLRAVQGERGVALDQALLAASIARENLRLISRSLSERQALQYAASHDSGLDLALSLTGPGLDPPSRRGALDALVRSRALVLDEMAARQRAAITDPKVASLAARLASTRSRLANLVVRGQGELSPEAYREALDDAQRVKEEAERALAGASESFAAELSRQALGLEEVVAGLPPDGALVAFAEYGKITFDAKSPDAVRRSYLAFVLRSDDPVPQIIDLGAAATLDGLVASWRMAVSSGGPESADREAGVALREAAWDPLLPRIAGARRVFVVPDGALNLVSLGALPMEDGHYLLEGQMLVHYLSAERDLVSPKSVRSGESLLAVGAPSYDAASRDTKLRNPETVAKASYRGPHSACGAFADARFEPLPASGRETRDVIRLWQRDGATESVVDLRDKAATEAALKGAAPGRRVLHLATHGFFLGEGCATGLLSSRAIAGLTGAPSAPLPAGVTAENPLLLSGLALAGANHRESAGPDEDDGILTAEEIAALDLSSVEWAVLSACDTGLGEIKAGEGVFGLRRAFQVAGARTLIMSLWSVEDESARAWMKALYTARLKENLDTASSVRAASLAVLKERRAKKQSTHPFYWAGFVAAGDWR